MARDRKRPVSPFEGEDDAELVYLDSFTERSADAGWGDDDVDFEVTVEQPADDLDGLDDLFELTVVEPEEADTLPRPGGTRTALPRALSVLERVEDRDSVLDLLAFTIIPGASCTVVLLVRDEVAHGLRASGTELGQEEIRGLAAPLQHEGLLHRALEGRAVVRGAAGEDHTQQLISRYLRAPEPTEACVAPVVLGDRVVNLVCVQTAEPEGIRAEAVQAVEQLRAAAADAYLRVIRARKEDR